MARAAAARKTTGLTELNWPASQIEHRPIATLVPYARNARMHSEAQIAQLAASMQEWGWTSPVLVDENSRIIAGHGRVLAGIKLGLGYVPVVVARGWSESKVRAYVIADNKLAENASWNEELLRLELADLRIEGFDLGLMGFDSSDLADLLGENDPANEYSQKVRTPVYEPQGKQPAIGELADSGKAFELLQDINASTVSDAEKQFLIAAAQRHVIFDYSNIAEYYCHASAEMQALMEKSALVIIDINAAIKGGFVEMTERLTELCPDQPADADFYDEQ